jgi:peptidoglycan/LPS O-acetylase OafA/YrhL
MLGIIRFLLACGVLFSHVSLFPDSFARTMVSAFFVISGFLICLTIHRNYRGNALSYYHNRIVRIFPLHWFLSALIVGLWLFGWADYVDNNQPNAARITACLFLLPQHSGLLNAPTWTLSYEMAFFFLAPLLVRGGPRAIAGTLFGCLAFLGAFAGFQLAFEPFLLRGTPGSSIGLAVGILTSFAISFIYFMGGMLLFFVSEHTAKRSVPTQAIAVTLILGSFAISYQPWAQALCPYPAVFWGVLGATALLLLSWKGEVSRFSFWMGELCYPVYLFHYFVINAVTSQLPLYRQGLAYCVRFVDGGREAKFLINAAAVFLLTLAFSAVWLQIEIRWIRKLRATEKKEKATIPHPALSTQPTAKLAA